MPLRRVSMAQMCQYTRGQIWWELQGFERVVQMPGQARASSRGGRRQRGRGRGALRRRPKRRNFMFGRGWCGKVQCPTRADGRGWRVSCGQQRGRCPRAIVAYRVAVLGRFSKHVVHAERRGVRSTLGCDVRRGERGGGRCARRRRRQGERWHKSERDYGICRSTSACLFASRQVF